MKKNLFVTILLILSCKTFLTGQTSAVGLNVEGGYNKLGFIYAIDTQDFSLDTLFEFKNPNHINPAGSSIIKGKNGKYYTYGVNGYNPYITEYDAHLNQLHSFSLFYNNQLNESKDLIPIGDSIIAVVLNFSNIATLNIFTREVKILKNFPHYYKVAGKRIFKYNGASFIGIWESTLNQKSILFSYDIILDSFTFLDSIPLKANMESIIKVDSIIYGATNYGTGKDVLFEYHLNTKKIITTDTFSKIKAQGSDLGPPALMYQDSLLLFISRNGGNYKKGSVCCYNTKSKLFKLLHSFKDSSQGIQPTDFIILSDSLIISLFAGGSTSLGTVSYFNLKNSSITSVYSFIDSSNCRNPVFGSYLLSDSTFLGSTSQGGKDSTGNVYKFNFKHSKAQELKRLTPHTIDKPQEIIQGDKYTIYLISNYDFYKLWPYTGKYERIKGNRNYINYLGNGNSFKSSRGDIYRTGGERGNNIPGELGELQVVSGNFNIYNSYPYSTYGTPYENQWAELNGKLFNVMEHAPQKSSYLVEFDMDTKQTTFYMLRFNRPNNAGVFADTENDLLYFMGDSFNYQPPYHRLKVLYQWDVLKNQKVGQLVLDSAVLANIGNEFSAVYHKLNDTTILSYTTSGSNGHVGAFFTFNLSSQEVKMRQLFLVNDSFPIPTSYLCRMDSINLIYPCNIGKKDAGVAVLNLKTWKSKIVHRNERITRYPFSTLNQFKSALVMSSRCVPNKIIKPKKLDTFFQLCPNSTVPTPKLFNNCGDAAKAWTKSRIPLTSYGIRIIKWYVEDEYGNFDSINQVIKHVPVDLKLHRFGDTLKTLQPGESFRWLECSNGNRIINGETNNYFVQKKTGSYAVEIRDGNCRTISNCEFKCYVDTIIPSKIKLLDIHSYCGIDSVTPPYAITNCSDTLIGFTRVKFPLEQQNDTLDLNWTFSYDSFHTFYQKQKVILSSPDTNLTQRGIELISDDPSAIYQWFQIIEGVPSIMSGYRSRSFKPTFSGTYQVRLTHGECVSWSEAKDICVPKKPIPLNKKLPKISSACYIPFMNAPKAYNLCGDTFLASTKTSFPISTSGETIITWEYIDTFGNKTSQDQIVEISIINDSVIISPQNLKSLEINCSYAWLDCLNGYKVIKGEASQVFTPKINGIYAVEISKDECMDTSECFNFKVLSTSSMSKASINIVPNPSDASFAVQNLPLGVYSCAIYDIQGRKSLEVPNFYSNSKIDISELEVGVYTIILKNHETKTLTHGVFVKE